MAERIDGVPSQKKRKHSTDGTDVGSELGTEPANVDDTSVDGSESVLTPDIETDPGFLPNDVVLVVEDQHLHVNKDLLVAASPVFATWLKNEWQNEQGVENTKKELLFPGKSYHDMVTFLKCLLPFFHDTVTDKTLDTVLPLADEYQAEALVTKCAEVIRQRVESVSKTDTYIPPSRIVTYLLWVDQFKLHTVKEYVVRLASYLKCEELEAVPEYENVSGQLQLEIHKARAKLLGSIFVRNVTEAEQKMNQLQMPISKHYMPEWKQMLATLVEGAVNVHSNPEWGADGDYIYICHKAEITVLFACLYICDRFDFSHTYERCVAILSSNLTIQMFVKQWSKIHSSTSSYEQLASMDRYVLKMSKSTLKL